MIIEHRFQWNLQPTAPVVAAAEKGKAAYNRSLEYITLENNQRPEAPGKLGGELSLASFNVLNYFTDLGADEAKCKFYKDREGNGVTANNCKVRGAYSAAAFERQEGKIVAAINALDASVLGLEEIENSAGFGHDRDASLQQLVTALNKDAGFAKWAAAPSPKVTPKNEDVIRLAFIYQPALLELAGTSQILDNDWFTKTARQPLAQKFRVKGAAEGNKEFVVIVNHLKSKGSLSKKIPQDTDEYQGNNNKLRTEQVKALTAWAAEKFADDAVFIIGDLNSYSQEDSVIELEKAGYTNLAAKFGPLAPSYQFDGLVGSLDHALANAKAAALTTGAQVWGVNAMEPIAFEYSRYNYNISYEQLFDNTAFRSSDHDPIKVGFKFSSADLKPDMPTPDVPGADKPDMPTPDVPGADKPDMPKPGSDPVPNIPANPPTPTLNSDTQRDENAAKPNSGSVNKSRLAQTGAGVLGMIFAAAMLGTAGIMLANRRREK
ncbi:ExeM/NucH family extracellular endonuclease [Arcanobacterium hippocoleae]